MLQTQPAVPLPHTLVFCITYKPSMVTYIGYMLSYLQISLRTFQFLVTDYCLRCKVCSSYIQNEFTHKEHFFPETGGIASILIDFCTSIREVCCDKVRNRAYTAKQLEDLFNLSVQRESTEGSVFFIF